MLDEELGYAIRGFRQQSRKTGIYYESDEDDNDKSNLIRLNLADGIPPAADTQPNRVVTRGLNRFKHPEKVQSHDTAMLFLKK